MSEDVIKKAIQQIAAPAAARNITAVDGTVLLVDVDARTCLVEVNNGTAITEITARISPVVGDGFILIPAVGSGVIVNYSIGIVPYISQFSDVEKVLFFVGESTIEIEDGSIVINGGNLGGLIKIDDLVNKLNAIENKLNTIITWGGTVTPPLSTSPMINTQKTDIEDDKVKH